MGPRPKIKLKNNIQENQYQDSDLENLLSPQYGVRTGLETERLAELKYVQRRPGNLI